MPINVQPGVITDPAQVIQRSTQVQNESAAQAFRNAQAGQQASSRGMDRALHSAESASAQAAASARTAQELGAQQMQAGMAAMMKRKDEKTNREREERKVTEQMDDEKFETNITTLASIEQSRIDAMDENGEVSPEFQAKYDSVIVGVHDSMQHDSKAKWIDGLGPAIELRGMSASVAKKRLAEGQDAVDRNVIVQQQQASEIEAKAKIVAGTVGVALQSTNTLAGIERHANSVAAAVKALPSDATLEQKVDAAQRAMAYPVFRLLSEGGREFQKALDRNDRAMMLHLVETGKATPSEVDIVAGFSFGMGNRMVGPDGAAKTTSAQEVSGRLDDDVRSALEDRVAQKNISLLYVQNKAESLRSRYIEEASNVMHGEANIMADETGISVPDLMTGAAALLRSDRKAPTGADATALSPGAGGGNSAIQTQLNATGMLRPGAQPTETGGLPEGEVGSPAPMDELREALDIVESNGIDEDYLLSPEERTAKLKKATQTILKEVARNKLFLGLIGGNQAAADSLAKLVKSKETLASTTAMQERERDTAATMLQEHIGDTSGALGKLWYQASGGQAERAGQYLPAKIAGERSPEQLSQDIVLAEMVRQGVLTKGRAFRISEEMGPGARQALLEFLEPGGARITTPEIRGAVRDLKRSKLTREAEARR